MGLVTRLLARSLAWYFGIGNQASIRIVSAEESRVTVRILAPAGGYELVELSGAATPIDAVGVRAPEGWSRSDGEVEGKPWAVFSPPRPIPVRRAGVELTLSFANPAAPPSSLSVRLETKRIVGGGGSAISFPAGRLLPEEADVYNRRADLFADARRRGVSPREVPGFAELEALEERARKRRGMRR